MSPSLLTSSTSPLTSLTSTGMSTAASGAGVGACSGSGSRLGGGETVSSVEKNLRAVKDGGKKIGGVAGFGKECHRWGLGLGG